MRLGTFPRAAVVSVSVVGAVVLGIASISSTGGLRPWERRSASIVGTVSLPGEGSLPGVSVTLDEKRETLTDQEGRFAFDIVPPGHHLLSARLQASRYQYRSRIRAGRGRTLEVDVTLREEPAVGTTVGVLLPGEIPGGSLNVQDVVGLESLIVLCDPSNGFWVVDVSDPETPAYLGRNTDGRRTEAAAFGWPYLFTGWTDPPADEGGIAAYLMTDPSTPVKTGEVVTGNIVYSVSLRDGLLYAIGRTSFQIYDVRDPSSPALLSSLPLRGEGVAVRGDYAFLGTRPKVFTVVNISDPFEPWVVWESAEESYTTDCTLSGNSVFISSGLGVVQYDVRDPEDPRLVNIVDDRYVLDQGAELRDDVLGMEGLQAADSTVYLGAVFDGLIAIDYSDPHRPLFSWQSNADDLVPFAMNVWVDDRYAYVASWREGFRVVRRK